jgi:hypothetical protein
MSWRRLPPVGSVSRAVGSPRHSASRYPERRLRCSTPTSTSRNIRSDRTYLRWYIAFGIAKTRLRPGQQFVPRIGQRLPGRDFSATSTPSNFGQTALPRWRHRRLLPRAHRPKRRRHSFPSTRPFRRSSLPGFAEDTVHAHRRVRVLRLARFTHRPAAGRIARSRYRDTGTSI